MESRLRALPLLSLAVFILLILRTFLPADAAQLGASSRPQQLEALLQAGGGDVDRIRDIVLDDLDAAERLFLSCLERDLGRDPRNQSRPSALSSARRLAEVFFRLFEFDFELGIVSEWEKASPARKAEWIPILRDHFTAYQEARKANRRKPKPFGTDQKIVAGCLALAERYRTVSLGKGELQALLWASSLEPNHAWNAWQLAKRLGDEVGEAWGAYYYGIWGGEGQPEFAARHAVEAAEKLRFPKLQQSALTRMAWRELSRDDYEAHVEYFRKGLAVIRTIPIRQTIIGKSSSRPNPGEAWFLMALWRALALKEDPAGRELFEQGRELSRRYGGKAGELRFLIDATEQFIRPGVFSEVAAQAEALARELGDPGWLAEFLAVKAYGLSGTQESAKAIAAVTEAAELYKKMGERGYYGECLMQRAGFRLQENDISGATADFEEAIKIVDEIGPAVGTIGPRIEAGTSLRSQPKSALRLLDEAIAIAEKIDSPGHLRHALMIRSQILESNSPARSLEDLKRALPQAERHARNTGYPHELLGTMRALSQAFRRAGSYADAMEMEKRRADKARAEGLPDAEADAYYWMMTVNANDLGEPEAAARFADQYTAMMTRPGKKLNFNNYNRIAGAYITIGQPARGLEYLAKGLQVAKGTAAGEPFQRMAHINLGRIHLTLGDYEAALAELEQEQALIERTFDSYRNPIEIQKAECFNKKAYLHVLTGDLSKAVEDARQAIAQEFQTPLGTAPAGYYTYFTPGDALALAGRFDEAIDFQTKRRDRARAVKSPHQEREALEPLGATLLRAGRLDEARQALQAAVQIERQPPGPQTGSLADSLRALGDLELRAGALEEAEKLLLEARTVANPFDLNQIWRIEKALAQAYVRKGRRELAEQHYELALEAMENARERLRPEEFSLRFGIDRTRIYDEYAGYLAGQALASGREAEVEKALAVLERRRAQSLWDLMSIGWSNLPPDTAPEQLRRFREVETRLESKQRILRAQYALPPDRRNREIISRLESELKTGREEHAGILAALAQGQYRFASPSRLPADLVAQVRKRLGPGRVLVEFLVAEEATYAFVVSSSDLRVEKLSISRSDLRRQVQALLQPFYRLRTGEGNLARLGFDFETAHELYRRLLAPLEPRFRGASRIILVPDDALRYLPFELLVDKLPPQSKEKILYARYEEAGFAVKRFTMSYQTSAFQLLRGPDAPSRPAVSAGLLALADPSASPDPSATEAEDPVIRRLRSARFGAAFTPLPGSAVEVERIRKYFPADTAKVLSGASATETNYNAFCPDAGIVHFATHAVAADDHPFYSTLILAPDRQAREDGFLQAYEILRRPLRADLVVLSGCETAGGPVGRGEGLVGLVAAFQQAGARSVLATQWSIDESAADLMAAFYEGVAGGRPTAEALRDAKLQILKKRLRLGGTDVSLAHPFFWAPFVLVGNPDEHR